MDALTLVVVSGLAAAIMAASMFLLYRAGSRTPCLLDWTLAGLCFMASSGVALAACIMDLPHIGLPAAGNALYVAGHLAIAIGLRRHLGLAPRPAWCPPLLPAVIAVVLLLHALPFAQASVTNRMLLLAPLIVAIDGYVVALLWRMSRGESRSACLPLMLMELAFMAQLTLRAGYILLHRGTELTILGSHGLHTLGSLSVFLFVSVAGMGCALIVIRHQELALRKASLTDSLTGLLNRRALDDIAGREFGRGQRSGGTPCFVTFDIDHFKSVNDRFGHNGGDIALRHVTALAGQALRGRDYLFRTGGEEFAVLMSGCSVEQACNVGERLRRLIERTPLHLDGSPLAMTISAGAAACEPGDAGWEAALQRADAALYRAKEEGRNRVCAAGPVRLRVAAG